MQNSRRLVIRRRSIEKFAIEPVSEVSAPLFAEKWCGDRRNSIRKRCDIRLSETLLTPYVVLNERGQSLWYYF